MSEFNSEMKDGWDHPKQPAKMPTLIEFKKEIERTRRFFKSNEKPTDSPTIEPAPVDKSAS